MLRRTPLRRGAPMSRAPWRRSSAPVPAIPAPDAPFQTRSKPRRVTGPNKTVRNTVIDRAGGRCEICDALLYTGVSWTRAYSIHHRRPRGMGGTTDPAANTAANLLLLCGTGTTGCHGYLESHRGLARYSGWLVAQHQDPATVPVVIHSRGRTILTADGGYQSTSTDDQEATDA